MRHRRVEVLVPAMDDADMRQAAKTREEYETIRSSLYSEQGNSG